MKKIFFSLVLLLSMSTMFSQKTITKPEYSFCNLPGELTKIELTEDATVLHFHIKYPAGRWISIPKKTYIQDTKGGEKMFVSKADGIPLEKKYTMPESGEVQYQLYFPKLNNTVNTIDYGEANEGGTWMIYDIAINETKESSVLPKELLGNWLQTDGSNQWDYGFYAKNAIVDKAIWSYKTVEKKKTNYTIVLESNGKLKTVYAQINKNGAISFGSDKLEMKRYSTTKTENPNYKIPNDDVYSEMVFKTDSATYSGVLKNYSPRAGKKTGTIAVDNVFTGNQDSYLVKIADDGSFSVKFPINHPQSVWVELPNFNDSVFVEPRKETFHLANTNTSLFMGDCARINADLYLLKNSRNALRAYDKLRKTIIETSPQEFKNACVDIKNKQIESLNALANKQQISHKAMQICKLDIEFGALWQMTSYNIFRKSAINNKSSKATLPENNLVHDFKLDASYYDFISESILNNQLGVISTNYKFFINFLTNDQIIMPLTSKFSNIPPSEIAEHLQKNGINLTKEELEMIKDSKKTELVVSRKITFSYTNIDAYQKFTKDHKVIFDKLKMEKPDTTVSISDVADYLSANGTPLSKAEKELIIAFKAADFTKEEKEFHKQYWKKYELISKLFNEKYETKIQEIRDEIQLQRTKNRLNEVFGVKDAFVYDVYISQEQLGKLEKEFVAFSDEQLKSIQEKIKHPFISNYIATVNNKLKAKNEANKNETGFTVNTVNKSEGDDLFESMIAKFKGKVIYVDFWATWCAPCMQGIKEIAPLKEDMKNENVVFLYITNPTSPEKTWNAKIPNIKGEHYRVSDDEWNYLTQKFNIAGIPHYVLVNKNGEIVNPKLGFHSNDKIKQLIENQLK